MMHRILLTVVYTVLFTGAAIGFFLQETVEKSSYATKIWKAGYVPSDYYRLGAVSVDVVETSGVCIYVVQRAGSDKELNTHLVLKKDLGAGKGC